MPLLFLFLSIATEQLSAINAIITINTGLNGLLNAATAVSILIFVPKKYQYDKLSNEQHKLASNIFSLCASILTLPLLILSFVYIESATEDDQITLKSELVSSSSVVSQMTESFLQTHKQVIEYHAQLVSLGVPSQTINQSMVLSQINYPAFFNITTVDSDGNLLYFAPENLNESVNRLPQSLKNIADRQYFIDAKFGRETSISEAILSKGIVVEPMISIASPTFQNDVFSGIVFGAINLAAINELKNNIEQLTEQPRLVIVDSKGKTLFINGDFELSLLEQFTPLISPHYISKGLLVVKMDGQNYFINKTINRFGWQIYVLDDLGTYANHLKTKYFRIGIAIILVISLFLLFAYNLSTRITAPLVELLNPETQEKPAEHSILSASKEFSDVANKLKRTQFLMQSFEDRLKQQVTEKTVQLEQLNLQLAAQAREDGMTQLLNRSGFEELALNAIKTSYRLGLPFSLALLDIDYFKQINDTYGHPFGDKCLQAFSALMQRNCKRDTDIIGRYGGEEFIILMSGKDVESHHKMMQSIHEQTALLKLHSASGEEVTFTVSIGVCSILGNVNLTLHDIVELADEQLYKCKRAGRNRVSVVNYGFKSEDPSE
ncbi:sensor domain-containing diguanylate cyclase [Agaribacter flavus]|uniref:diguanylate cyclase n=1 Tax=Agaribacter flavus TaxID=1902781 RepID=A0ABV7FPF1_9ALTE